MVVKTNVPRAENGGLAVDARPFYDPNDTRRPALDLAAPTAFEVETFHLAPVIDGYEGYKPEEVRRIDVTCIGAGLGGITTAMLAQWRLKNCNLKVLEKNKKPAGTWAENKYAGCRCDLASHFYSWRWELNDWSAEYSESDEIEAYFRRIATKYNLDEFCTYEAEVIACRWLEDRQLWEIKVRTPQGEKTDYTHVIINGQGFLNNVSNFKFPGEELFKGPVMHTARYDRSVDLKGKTVAVIGNGSSGIQTIGTIGFEVGQLHSYQRNNTYIIAQVSADGGERIDVHEYNDEERAQFKNRDYAYNFYVDNWKMMDAGWPLFVRGSPESEAGTANALRILEKLVPDPAIRATLTPTYPLGCRRLTPHPSYFKALTLPTTTIIRDNIERFTPDGIIAGGVERKCDVIIKAIGFNVEYTPRFEVTGKDGMTLRELWKDYPFTYKSMCNSGFPNFYWLIGPNAPVASNSIHIFEEHQIQWVIQIVQRMQTQGEVAFDPKKEVEQAWHDDLQERLKPTVWHLDCGGWYRHKSGKLTSHYPGPSLEFMDELKNPIYSDFNIVKLSDMKDPKSNEIPNPMFGADVEKIAKIGPPRMPQLPADVSSDIAEKIAALSI